MEEVWRHGSGHVVDVLSVLHHCHQVQVEVSVDVLLGVPSDFKEETAEDLFEVPSDVKVARMELRVGTKLYCPLLCCEGFLTTARRLLRRHLTPRLYGGWWVLSKINCEVEVPYKTSSANYFHEPEAVW